MLLYARWVLFFGSDPREVFVCVCSCISVDECI